MMKLFYCLLIFIIGVLVISSCKEDDHGLVDERNRESAHTNTLRTPDRRGNNTINDLTWKGKELNIEWKTNLGGEYEDYARSVLQTTDGGYVVAGSSNSFNGPMPVEEWDYWITKLDAGGGLIWEVILGGSQDDHANCIQQTSDDGYIIAGHTNSSDGDVGGNNGSEDYWITKLDATGALIWEANVGGSSSDVANAIQQTADGGYIVAGGSVSSDGDVGGNLGGWDYWIVRLTSDGTLKWETNLGGSSADMAHDVQQTADGGYIVGGYSFSANGDVGGNNGGGDYWVVKLNVAGNLEWESNLGGSAEDFGRAIQQTTDGGYIVAGYSYSSNGDVGANNGNSDYWIVKLNAFGNLEWETNLGGSGNDVLLDIQQTSDDGYILAGRSYSSDGDVGGNQGAVDYWIAKLGPAGNLAWEANLGGSGYDTASAIQQTADGGYIIAGFAISSDGDVENNNGGADYWVIKLQ
ncbi:hypothetical protein QQ020_27675 [Fulvivirgaceae bacterium BMA12]|uniref:T9SS C-terminal target domain-containing protein n=1 Tax=Agaribacillus aureus TaxID=3051825 RepID=A0ABT8LE59_9BACT|nr:hypothetical protein [Fulvivirgaceae bacterium BMA12]